MAHVQSGLYRILVDTQTGIRSIGKSARDAEDNALITRPFDPDTTWEVVRVDNETVILKANGLVISPHPTDRSLLATIPSADPQVAHRWILKDLGSEEISIVDSADKDLVWYVRPNALIDTPISLETPADAADGETFKFERV